MMVVGERMNLEGDEIAAELSALTLGDAPVEPRRQPWASVQHVKCKAILHLKNNSLLIHYRLLRRNLQPWEKPQPPSHLPHFSPPSPQLPHSMTTSNRSQLSCLPYPLAESAFVNFENWIPGVDKSTI